MSGKDKATSPLPIIKVEGDDRLLTIDEARQRFNFSEIKQAPLSPRMATSESLKNALETKHKVLITMFEDLEKELAKEDDELEIDKAEFDMEYLEKYFRGEYTEAQQRYGSILMKELKPEDNEAASARYTIMASRLKQDKFLVKKTVRRLTLHSAPDKAELLDQAKTLMEIEQDQINDIYVDLERLDLANDQGEKNITSGKRIFEALELFMDDFDLYYKKYSEMLIRENQLDLLKKAKSQRANILLRKLDFERLIFGSVGTLKSTTPMQQTAVESTIRLPKRELPKFNGDVKNWLVFWAAFEPIHSDPNLADTYKFEYLLQSMEKESHAQRLIMSYPLSGPNYAPAVTSLRERFGKESTLIKVYVRDLHKLVLDNATGKKMEFIELVTQLTSQLRNLESLGVTKDKYALMFYPLVELCLPLDTLTAWQRHPDFKEDLEDLLKFLEQEVSNRYDRKLAQSQFSSEKKNDLNNQPNKNGKGSPHNRNGKDVATASTLYSSNAKTDSSLCCFCERNHPSQECRNGRRMSMDQKKEILKKKGLCFICYERHLASSCSCNVKCPSCSGRHFLVMCAKPAQNQTIDQKQQPQQTEQKAAETDPVPGTSPKTGATLANQNGCTEVPLQTILVTLHGNNGKTRTARALLDSGSQRSYILEHLAKDLHLQKICDEELSHLLFGGVITPPQKHEVVKLFISGLDGTRNCNFNVSCIPKISENIPAPTNGPWLQEFGQKGVYISDMNTTGTAIEVLIGNDVLPRLYTGKIVTLSNGPVAIETIWGFVLAGKLPIMNAKRNTNSMLVTGFHITDKPLADLWALDTLGITDPPESSTLECDTQQHFDETVSTLSDGRYEIHLPWISGMKDTLTSNYHIADRRLHSTTKNLLESGYLDKYDNLFRKWEKDKMIEEVPKEDSTSFGHYLPHRAVVKLSSSTTPVRPVFDASAHSRGNPSLNDCLDKGPNLLELIPAIVTRFRLHRIGVTSDIAKAFQQISVTQDHRDYLRFLWWKDKTYKQIKILRHNRVVFGVSPSPFLLGATLQHHLKDVPASHEKTAMILRRSLYVDNCLVSLPNLENARLFQKQSQDLLLPAKFDLRGWEIGPQTQEKTVPILGLLWNMKKDTLAIDPITALEKMNEEPSTQRKVLSLAHTVFYPMGFVSPYTLLAKLLLRKCQEMKMGWDKPLPPELDHEFKKWKAQIPLLSEISIPRHTSYGSSRKKSLHVFCDASQEAYATVIFLRCEDEEGVSIHLLQSKARVSPKHKKISIPRLELIACNIGSRLIRRLLQDLENPDIPVTMWTDSTTALWWILNDGPWGVFVGNRREEVKKLTDPSWWRHVPGRLNPADVPSRGANLTKIMELKFLEGPTWLKLSEESWPTSSEMPNVTEVDEERRKTVVSNLASDNHHPIASLLRVSSYDKILRILGYVLRFVKNTKERKGNPKAKRQDIAPPTLKEIQQAEVVVLRFAQLHFEEKLSRLKGFSTFKDENGILRLQTRLIHHDEELFKSPILLPGDEEFTTRLIMREHRMLCHAGTQVLLGHLREKYWITNGRRTVRKVIHSCMRCHRLHSKKLEVPMPPLPTSRTETGIAFNVVGVDMAGPLMLKERNKVWIALFTCAIYRAIHLEVVDSLSTEAYLQAFRRFVARRGKPSIIYSDNGLNFVCRHLSCRHFTCDCQ